MTLAAILFTPFAVSSIVGALYVRRAIARGWTFSERRTAVPSIQRRA
jgi:hypothetical protein